MIRGGLVALAATCTAGVAARYWRMRNSYGPRRALEPSVNGIEDVPSALLQATGTELLPGNAVDLLADDRVFDALADAIVAARSSIHFDMFIWKSGPPGERIVELLTQRAAAGLPVRVLVDPIGSPGFDACVRPRLAEAGCEIRYFRPLRRHPFTLTGRNHRKIAVIDGRIGFTGGFGIAGEWGTPGKVPWREVSVRVSGPVVRQMQLAFAAHWLETGGSVLPDSAVIHPAESGTTRAAFVTSMDVKGLSNARWLTHIALASARRRLWIANPYFVPLPQLLSVLKQRSREGVDVRLLLPGPHQDHPSARFIQRRLYRRLGEAGVTVYEYQPSMMHAKTMLVDDDIAIVGSINLDVLSQEMLDEGSLVAIDKNVAQALERQWLRDIPSSHEVVTGRRGEARARSAGEPGRPEVARTRENNAPCGAQGR